MASAGTPPGWKYSPKLQGYYYIDERGDRPKTLVTSDGRRYPVDGSVPWTMEAAAMSNRSLTRTGITRASDYQVSPRTPRTQPFEVAGGRGQFTRYAAPSPDTTRPAHPTVSRAVTGGSARATQYRAVPVRGSDLVNARPSAARRPDQLDQPRLETLLNEEYKVQNHPRSFYVTGKVFMTLWAEPARANSTKSNSGEISDSVVTEGPNGELIFSKVRRFVVIRTGDRSCSALPIVTYTSAKALAPGYLASEHGIIYSGERPIDEARHLPGLLPQAVRVQLDNPSARLDTQTLVDYSAVHTIDHDLKVKSLGRIDDDSTEALLKQWKNVFVAKVPLVGSSPPRIDNGAARRQLDRSTGTRQGAVPEARSPSYRSSSYDAASLANSVAALNLAGKNDEEARGDSEAEASESDSSDASNDIAVSHEISQSTPDLQTRLTARSDDGRSKSTANAFDTAISALQNAGYTRPEAVALLRQASHTRANLRKS
ncbi:hypothetical protein B0A48_15767 [Cryoendolithus antarcticus]|uniref:DUF6590 domain-containing protein n=1 Tax=Cryoendolithus antarcticus TaxID=1507870 RepID=A0A1V8SH91_9PEZI|nr:hypothetical protein B0A48_15767 [Cryoendolithus antarcticus]